MAAAAWVEASRSAGRRGRQTGPARRGRRKVDPDALRERRQRPRRRRQARATEGIPLAGAPAQLAGQAGPRDVPGTQGAGEPIKRPRIEMAETDLHATGLQEPDHQYKCWTLKDTALRAIARHSR